MGSYWLRLVVAWLLLRVASSVVKDAERLLKENADRRDNIIEGTATAPVPAHE